MLLKPTCNWGKAAPESASTWGERLLPNSAGTWGMRCGGAPGVVQVHGACSLVWPFCGQWFSCWSPVSGWFPAGLGWSLDGLRLASPGPTPQTGGLPAVSSKPAGGCGGRGCLDRRGARTPAIIAPRLCRVAALRI